MSNQPSGLITITPHADEPLDQAIEQAFAQPISPLADLATLTNVALGDPALAEQLALLRHTWELQPEPAHGIIARIRTRIAWWLLGPELRQASRVHATMLRLIDSMIVLVDQERAARRRMEEQMSDSDT
ncbi:MAG: hypothetical protein SH847_03810 [Roseiflexaceae bacterium]|nr:hypothetical protein [Roseiflexaceae bacterium]